MSHPGVVNNIADRDIPASKQSIKDQSAIAPVYNTRVTTWPIKQLVKDSTTLITKVEVGLDKTTSPALTDTVPPGSLTLKSTNAPVLVAGTNAQKDIISATENGKSVKNKIIKPASYRPQFAISVIASSDINGVNSFSQSRVGTNFGALFSLGVLKKFTITTGAVYSIKPYSTGFENYTTSYVFKQNPLTVAADCRILDVPINLGYQVYNKHRNKLSVGTGLSSYFMLYEKYSYNYSSANAVGPKSYTVPNSKNYLASILNFSTTYERQLNSKFGLIVQPYLKVPLRSVSYSQVNLQSTGVAVGINWHLNSLTKP